MSIKVILNSITPGTGAKPFDSEINVFGNHFLKNAGRLPHTEWTGELGVVASDPVDNSVLLKKGTYLVDVERPSEGSSLNYTPYDAFKAHVQVYADLSVATSGAGKGALIIRVKETGVAVGATNSTFGTDEVSIEFLENANAEALTDNEIQALVGDDFAFRIADIDCSGATVSQVHIEETGFSEAIFPGGIDLNDSILKGVKTDLDDPTSAMPRSEILDNIEQSQLQPIVDSIVLRNDEVLLSDPTVAPVLTASGNTGQDIDNGTWRVKYSWLSASGETLYSPEAVYIVSGFESFNVEVPDIASLPGVIATKIAFAYQTGSDTYKGHVTLAEGVTSYEFAEREPNIGKGTLLSAIPATPVAQTVVGSSASDNHPQGSYEYSYALIGSSGQVTDFSPWSAPVAVGTASPNTYWVKLTNIYNYYSGNNMQLDLGFDVGATPSGAIFRVRESGGTTHYLKGNFSTTPQFFGTGDTSADPENIFVGGFGSPKPSLALAGIDYNDYNIEQYIRDLVTENTSNVSLTILNELNESGELRVARTTTPNPDDSVSLNFVGTIDGKSYKLILTIPQ